MKGLRAAGLIPELWVVWLWRGGSKGRRVNFEFRLKAGLRNGDDVEAGHE